MADFYDGEETLSMGDYCYDPNVTEPDTWPGLPDDPEPVNEPPPEPTPEPKDDDRFIVNSITPFEMPKLAKIRSAPPKDPTIPKTKKYDVEVETERKKTRALIAAIAITVIIGIVIFASIIAQSNITLPSVSVAGTIEDYIPVFIEVAIMVSIVGAIMKVTGSLDPRPKH